MIYRFSDCILDSEQHKLYRAGNLIDIEPKVFEVLLCLLEQQGELVTHDQLFERCWPGMYVSEGTLTRCLSRVRRAIGHATQCRLIETVHRRGYRFIGEVAEGPEPEPVATVSTPPVIAATPAATSAPAPAGPAPAPAQAESAAGATDALSISMGAERRQLTVLSCQRINSADSDALDAEELYQIEQAFRHWCLECLIPLGAYLAQTLRDGLVFYFGYPQAQEDSARRAVLAGLQLLDKVPQTPAASTPAGPLQVRMGIHTGVIIVEPFGQQSSPRALLTSGPTELIAMQLSQQAPAQRVVISETTARLVAGYFDWQPLPSVPPAPAAYQVLAESLQRSRFDTETAAAQITPFVGREPELALLRERWIQVQEGMGQAVLISGEAGIGKSRLVKRLQQQIVGEDSTRLECRCSAYHQNTALFPLIELLQRILQSMMTDTAASELERLEVLIARYRLPAAETVPLLAALLSLPLPQRYAPLTLSPPQQRRQSLQLLLNLLLLQAQIEPPLLLIVEDLHWVDPSTLEFIELLLEQVTVSQLLVVLTCRPDFVPPWNRQIPLTPLRLDRLNRSQIEQMLWRLTGGKALPALVIEQIAGKTDGVPLFVEELTRMLLESGQLRQTGQGFELTASFDQLAIPLTLQDSLMARLDRLGPGKEIAQWAAVLGREFSHELLAAAVPFAEAALQQGLEALLEAGLLHQRGLAPQARYIFKHALIRDIAYQSLLKRQRQQLHQRIAEVLEARFGAITRTQPELLAWHYERAQQSEPSIGYWHRAGQLALERSAYQEAIRHLQHALELLATLPDTPARARRELELQITLGPALGAARGSAAVELQQAYSRALDLSSQLGEQSQRFSVLFGLWRFHVMRSQALHARALAEQCLELAQQNNDSGLLLGAHWALGVSQFMLGELAQAHEQFRQGAALYDARVHHVLTFRYGFDPGIYGLLYDSLTLWLMGYPQQSLAQNEAAMTAARLKPHHYNLALAHYFTARLHQFRREPDAALIQAEAALALCQEHDIAYFGASSMIVQGWAFAMQHEYQQGIALMQQGWTAIRAMQGKVWGAFLLACQTEGHLANGRFEPAWNTLTDVFRFRQDTEDCCWDGELQRLKGQLLLVRPGDSESDAENCLQQALDITRRQQARSLELRAATDLARLWLQQGKRDQAQALLAPVYAWFSEGFDSVDLRAAKALLESPGSLPEQGK